MVYINIDKLKEARKSHKDIKDRDIINQLKELVTGYPIGDDIVHNILYGNSSQTKIIKAICTILNISYESITHKEDSLLIGVDVGSSKISCGLIALDDRRPIILCQSDFDITESRTPENFTSQIADSIKEFCKAKSIDLYNIKSIGIGLPGMISNVGVLEHAPFFNLQGIDVASDIKRKLAVGQRKKTITKKDNDSPNQKINDSLIRHYQGKVMIDNDVNCAALGEIISREEFKIQDAICIFVGTGIGSGIIINSKIYRGSNGKAGEIGHIIISANSETVCNCGKKGCLENYASYRGVKYIAKSYFEGDIEPRQISNFLTDKNNPYHDAAVKCTREFLEYLAIGVANMISITGIDVVILGGGILFGRGNGSGLFNSTNEVQSYFTKFLSNNLNTNATILHANNETSPIIGSAMQ